MLGTLTHQALLLLRVASSSEVWPPLPPHSTLNSTGLASSNQFRVEVTMAEDEVLLAV